MTATGMPKRAAAVDPGAAQVELVLSEIESLPTLPEVAMRLLELTADDISSVRELVWLIESDQALSARLLFMAGRANLGANADTVERAVVLLGFDAVRNLVLAIRVFETFAQRAEAEPGQLDRLGFWKHSLAVGCAARLLAEAGASRSAPVLPPEEVFVCGLLHDLGKVVLDACFPKSYDRVITSVEALRGCICDVEREVFGVDHTVAGHRLAMHWNLPAMIGESIWLHHHAPASTPTRIAHAEYVRFVQVADRLVRQMHIGYSGNYSVNDSLSAIAGIAGMTEQEINRVASALPELIEARAELIGLNSFTSSEVYQEALTETNAELARVNSSLTRTVRGLEQRSRCFEALRLLHAGLDAEPTHEDVCLAAVGAAKIVAQADALAVCGLSPGRSILVIAASHRGPDSPRKSVMPASAAGNISSMPDPGESWQQASTLPRPLLDCLGAVLGRPPAWFWPIRDQGRGRGWFMGALVLPDDPPADSDESFAALSGALGAWLSDAESRALARQLNEELAEMNRRLVASQAGLARIRSLAMVGEMAAGAAHELNNPLAVISGRAQMLNRADVDDDVRRASVLIAEHAHRASGIVAELMDFAKPAKPEPTDLSLAALLGETRREWLQKASLTEEQFRLDLSDDLPDIRADASQIRRLFDELIRNAIEAMRDVSDPRLIINCPGHLADEGVMIRIQDNGCGMEPDVLERAIDPFFSHRPAGRGRGLGLSRAARYAEINGGRIRLSSGAGQGTVALIELPAAAGG